MKQRRIKKLVKGHLNKIDESGNFVYATKQQKIDRLAVLDESSNQDLITELGITFPGTINEAIDIDADGASHDDDFAPFDAREQVDTDNDGIGDNRDILLSKLAIDEIYKAVINGAGVGPTGLLQDEITIAESVNIELDAAAIDPDPEAALLSLQETASGDYYTTEGQDLLLSKIQGFELNVETLRTEISEMSATAGVVIDDEPFYDEPTYTAAGGALQAQLDADATDVVTPVTAVEAEISASKSIIVVIENL